MASASEPYTPATAATVLLQRTPGQAGALRAARAIPPSDPAAASRAARALIQQGRATGDVRYYGQAQALIEPWWNLPHPPADVLLLRATLRQQRHDFTGALQDLDSLLAADPANAQAHLTRAVVRLVRGAPKTARLDCAALVLSASFVTTATCLASADAASGRAAAALQTLETALAQEPQGDPETLRWAHTQAAAIAEQLGQDDRAAAHYAQALQLVEAANQRDLYLLAAQADFQLAHGQAAAVRQTLNGMERFDALALRLALAAKALGDTATVARLRADLSERFALAEARSDAAHTREQTMMALHLDDDPKSALQLAIRNWQVQREVADAALLLEAAARNRMPVAAEPVRQWQRDTGIEHPALSRWLNGGSP